MVLLCLTAQHPGLTAPDTPCTVLPLSCVCTVPVLQDDRDTVYGEKGVADDMLDFLQVGVLWSMKGWHAEVPWVGVGVGA